MVKDKIEKEIKEGIKQLKVDLGILPYSDIGQPEKFANMSMKEAEENIDDFQEVILDKLTNRDKTTNTKEVKINGKR